MVIWPPVLGWLLGWVWRVDGNPLWVGLTVGGVGMLGAFAASPFAGLAAITEIANNTGTRRALAPLHVIWIQAVGGIGLAVAAAFIIDVFHGTPDY
jgi:hypothetical protein